MAKIYLIRHCESEGNACRRTQAHVDALVTTKGYEQNEMLRRRFKGNAHRRNLLQRFLPLDYDGGAHGQGAKPAGENPHPPAEVHHQLWEDGAWGNIAAKYPRMSENWSKHPWNMTAPGATTFQQVSDRLTFGLRRISGRWARTALRWRFPTRAASKPCSALLLESP